METVIFTLALCGLVIASLQFSYKNSQRINELEDKQDKSRKDINALYMKSLSKPKRKPTIKKPTTKKPTTKKSSHQRKSSTKKQVLKG
tara:strand:+ start:144 stop:407 length:264 start_codon:yes stop_codon:yes gene_type:complete